MAPAVAWAADLRGNDDDRLRPVAVIDVLSLSRKIDDALVLERSLGEPEPHSRCLFAPGRRPHVVVAGA